MASDHAFDLLLRGGRVFHPQQGRWHEADVGIRDGRVVAVAPGLEPNQARQWVEVGGNIVCPGLIDLHVHAYHGATFWGLDLDRVSLASGVTSVVDAGSAGAYTFAGLSRILSGSALEAKAFLNIAGTGLASPFGEFLVPEQADVAATVAVAKRSRDRSSASRSGRLPGWWATTQLSRLGQ